MAAFINYGRVKRTSSLLDESSISIFLILFKLAINLFLIQFSNSTHLGVVVKFLIIIIFVRKINISNMKKIFEYTADFDNYDSEEPYNEVAYRILIKHDNSQNLISQKFSFSFLDLQGHSIDDFVVNSWKIRRIYSEDYFGRAIVCVNVVDPVGSILQPLKSGGFTLSLDERQNINEIENKLFMLLKQVRRFSCFMNLRSRLDYVDIVSSEEDGVPSHKL
ncbi:MAG TPA: hypothetical protein DEP77_10380 [Bacteroidales bacterium]|nr:hypothetical protein [Bacteroidales bacterium]